MSDNLALRESLAFEIKRWKPAKTFTQARADADTVIAALELPTPGVIPVVEHPLVPFVADAFIVDWPAANAALTGVVQIAFPDLVLTAEANSGGSRTGFRFNAYGAVNPEMLNDGSAILRLWTRNTNGRLHLEVEGSHPQNAFRTMEIAGIGAVDTSVNCDYTDTGLETIWKWNPGVTPMVPNNTYAIEFT